MENSDDDDSSNDEFFTPPQSPTLEYFDDSDEITHNNFIFGYVHEIQIFNSCISTYSFFNCSQEPTKMDNDVFKALHDVAIDKNAYLNVHQWHNAMMKFSLEERARYALD